MINQFRNKYYKKPKAQSLAYLIKNNVLKYVERSSDINALVKLFEIEKETYVDSSFVIYVNPETEEKVNDHIRDEEVEKILDLNKVYFGLPFDVMCYVVAIIDKFITKVKVKPKYMACLAAACLQIAAFRKGHCNKFLESEYLANLLRFGATAGDLDRLRQIVENKLGNFMPKITIVDFVRVMQQLQMPPKSSNSSPENDNSKDSNGDLNLNKKLSSQLIRIIEVAITRFRIVMHKPSHVALACLLLLYRNEYFQEECRIIGYNKIDVELVKMISDLISTELCNRNDGTIQNKRDRLLWVISRKTLSKMQNHCVPQLETIKEE